MKVTDKNKGEKRKLKKKPIDKTKKQQVAVVAQEIKFARLLSGNEKKTRDRVLKALKKWLVNCFEKNYEFKEDDFVRVWKGLFYAVWMSDKPNVQEDLCESIAAILDLFPNDRLAAAMLFARAGFKVLATEWFGIDQHRIDKFLMLVRRYLRGALRCIKRCEWSEDACNQFADMLAQKDGILAVKIPMYARNAGSMALHIADCYLEEISKVSSGAIPPDSLCILLRPFVQLLSLGDSGSFLPLCLASRRVITELLQHGDIEGEAEDEETEQDSEEEGDDVTAGDAHHTGTQDSDDDVTDGPLDPRAGHVDVILHPLPVPATQLAAMLRRNLTKATGAGNRRTRKCIALLEQFASGSNPLNPPPPTPEPPPALRPARVARALRRLEKELVASGDELALRGLSRKHRKRLLAKSRAGHSIVDDVVNAKTDKHTNANGDWQVEETGELVKRGKKKRKQANKENVAEPKNKRPKLEHKPTEKESNDKIKSKKEKAKLSVKNKVKDVKSKMDKVKVEKRKEIDEKVNVNKEKESVIKVKSDEKVNIKNNIKTTKERSKKEINGKLTKNEEKLKLPNKKFQKQDKANSSLNGMSTPKKVKFELKNNSMQGTLDYYKSVWQSPNIPFDSSKKPSKTNLKVSTPSPINPFFKKKMTRRASFAAQIVY